MKFIYYIFAPYGTFAFGIIYETESLLHGYRIYLHPPKQQGDPNYFGILDNPEDDATHKVIFKKSIIQFELEKGRIELTKDDDFMLRYLEHKFTDKEDEIYFPCAYMLPQLTNFI